MNWIKSYTSGQFSCSWICSPLKKYLARSHERLPRNCWKLAFLASERVFFSIRSGIAIVFDPAGSKKCWRWFPATEPLEKRETVLNISWRKLRLILRRGRPTSNIFGANAHANVLKGSFQRTAIQLHNNWPQTKKGEISVSRIRYLSYTRRVATETETEETA